MGPVPMTLGSTPACAQDTIRARGAIPRAAASESPVVDILIRGRVLVLLNGHQTTTITPWDAKV
jgi:hypothetical protein